MKIEEGKRLTEIYENRLEDFFRENKGQRRLDLSYGQVTEDPEKWVKKLINFLDLKTRRKQYQKAINFILPKDEIRELAKGMKLRDEVQRILSLVKSGIKQPWKIPSFLFQKLRSKVSQFDIQ